MQIQSNNHASSVAHAQDGAQVKMSAFELAKKAKDIGILKAHVNHSSQAADNPQKLLFKAAINEINDLLAPYLGENAAQKAYESDIDFSPEATADRIVDGATAFLSSFKENNPDLTEEESIERFNAIIHEGVNKGFEDAKGILDSLKVLEGKVSEDIDHTYDFVQQGLKNFTDTLLANLAQPATNTNNEQPTTESQA